MRTRHAGAFTLTIVLFAEGCGGDGENVSEAPGGAGDEGGVARAGATHSGGSRQTG
jgi:hypothetical protein